MKDGSRPAGRKSARVSSPSGTPDPGPAVTGRVAGAASLPAPPAPRDAKAPVTMDLLRLFSDVADTGSIAAAARRGNSSPSLATRKIAALERALKVRLFERTTRSVKLTEPGRIALDWARQTLASFDEVGDDLASLVARPAGTVRIAINHFAATVYLPPILERFARDYPEIRLAITATDSPVSLVQEGYDIAVHSGRVPDAGVVGVRVNAFRRVLCASPAYVARRGKPASVEDLSHHDCLVHSTNEPTNWFFRRGKRLIAQPIQPYIETDTHLVLIELVRRGLGIARISHNVVKDDLASGRLVELLPQFESVYSNGELPGLWILYPNRKVLYRTRVLIDYLTEALERRP
jgi:LysR family transcriptional activator of dmlA